MENKMSLKIGTNFAVFLLFFGIAALDALKSGTLSSVAFWLAVGSVFLLGDNDEMKKVRAG